MGDPTCHEGVTRKGEFQPCDKPAVALRIDPTEGRPYPVCIKHTRADMVPLAAPDELTAHTPFCNMAGHGPMCGPCDHHCRGCVYQAERATELERNIRALADEWENYECECEDADNAPYCLHRSGVHDFGRMLRAALGDS